MDFPNLFIFDCYIICLVVDRTKQNETFMIEEVDEWREEQKLFYPDIVRSSH